MKSLTMVRVFAAVAVAAIIAGCGSKDDSAVATKATPSAAARAAKAAKGEKARDEVMANAVAVGRAAGAVDLQYELMARPAAGQPFEIELDFVPRRAADTLEVEAHGMPGLEVVSGGTASFQGVKVGERYKVRLLVQPAVNGIYYVGIATKMSTKVQSEARAFAVPVVVADKPADKPADARPAAAGTVAAPVDATNAGETAE